LDHDLGGETFVDSGREDTGMEVVRWLCQNQDSQDGLIFVRVHSHNAPAAHRMVFDLKRAGYSSNWEFFPEGLR